MYAFIGIMGVMNDLILDMVTFDNFSNFDHIKKQP